MVIAYMSLELRSSFWHALACKMRVHRAPPHEYTVTTGGHVPEPVWLVGHRRHEKGPHENQYQRRAEGAPSQVKAFASHVKARWCVRWVSVLARFKAWARP